MTLLLRPVSVSMSRRGGFPSDPWGRQSTGRDSMVSNSLVDFRGAPRRLFPPRFHSYEYDGGVF